MSKQIRGHGNQCIAIYDSNYMKCKDHGVSGKKFSCPHCYTKFRSSSQSIHKYYNPSLDCPMCHLPAIDDHEPKKPKPTIIVRKKKS